MFNTRLYLPREPAPPSAEHPKTVAIEIISAGAYLTAYYNLQMQFSNAARLVGTDIEENRVRLRLNVVDTPGFGDFVNNDDG